MEDRERNDRKGKQLSGLDNFNESYAFFKKCIENSVDNYLEDSQLKLIFITSLSSFCNQYYIVDREVSDLRNHVILIGDGSIGKGILLRTVKNIYENIKFHKTTNTCLEIDSETTDKFLKGGVSEIIETKKNKNGVEKREKTKKVIPGALSQYSIITWEEGENLFSTDVNSKSRASIILNNTEKPEISIYTGEYSAVTSESTKEYKLPSQASFLLGSVPDINIPDSMILKNIMARFYFIYMPTNSKTITETIQDVLSTEWVASEKTKIFTDIENYHNRISKIFRNHDIKMEILTECEYNNIVSKCFKKDITLIKTLDEISNNTDKLFSKTVKGLLIRDVRNKIKKLAINICIINGNKRLNENHINEAYDIMSQSILSFIEYYQDYMIINTMNTTKNKHTIEKSQASVIKYIKNYYKNKYKEDGLMLKNQLIEQLQTMARNPGNHNSWHIRTKQSVRKFIDKMIKEGIIIEKKGDRNTKYIILKEDEEIY